MMKANDEGLVNTRVKPVDHQMHISVVILLILTQLHETKTAISALNWTFRGHRPSSQTAIKLDGLVRECEW